MTFVIFSDVRPTGRGRDFKAQIEMDGVDLEEIHVIESFVNLQLILPNWIPEPMVSSLTEAIRELWGDTCCDWRRNRWDMSNCAKAEIPNRACRWCKKL